MTAMQTLQTQSRRGRSRLGRRDERGRFASRPRRVRNASRASGLKTGRRANRSRGGSRGGRSRSSSRGSRARPRSVRTGRSLDLPERDARGRFTRRGLVDFVSASPRPSRSHRIVKRRWWRIDGPQDPTLPKGYTYET